MNKRKNKIINFAGICAVIIMFMFAGCGKTGSNRVYVNTDDDSVSDDRRDIEYTGAKGIEEIQTETVGYVYVQICGAVNQPGVYKVSHTLRIFEVIDLAGGVTQEADTDVINLARPVEDEMKIYVPVRGESTDEDFNNLSENDLYESDGTGQGIEDGLVNINQADEEELMTLPGIGEAKAAAIIAYREENGVFSDISEIMNISGIKQAAFDKIKDLIKV